MTYTKAITLLDGAMGTMLQRAGLKLGDRPETLSITAADVVEKIQRQYVQAGTRMLLANTFCANAHKLAGTGFDVEEVIRASVAVAKRACSGTLRHGNRRADHFFHVKSCSGQLMRVGAEGVGQQRTRSRLYIPPLDLSPPPSAALDGTRSPALSPSFSPALWSISARRAVRLRSRFRICHCHSSICFLRHRRKRARVCRAEHPSQPFFLS